MRGPDREPPAGPRAGGRERAERLVLTQKARGEPTCRFTSLIHLLDEEFLGESVRRLKKNKAPGPAGKV